MIASVHFADVGARHSVPLLFKVPKTATTPGLRTAHIGTAAQFGYTPPRPQPGRVGLIAFWDDDAALDTFLANDRLAATLADGWMTRLAPLRAHGTWPGLPDDTPKQRTVDHTGPVTVITIARFRWPRLFAFFRTSSTAEKAVVKAPGMQWTTALVRPPMVASISQWESSDALADYAYSGSDTRHADAIKVDRAKPFHHQSAFIRFNPYETTGSLAGRNAVAAT